MADEVALFHQHALVQVAHHAGVAGCAGVVGNQHNNSYLRIDLESLVGVHGELGKEVPLVNVNAPEPAGDHDVPDSGDLADLLAVGERHPVGDGNRVARPQAQIAFWRDVGGLQLIQNGVEGDQQEQGCPQAQYRQKRAAFVPQRTFQHQRCKLHGSRTWKAAILIKPWLNCG